MMAPTSALPARLLLLLLAAAATLPAPAAAWLPVVHKNVTSLAGKNLFVTSAGAVAKFRGVNLGSLFVVEPWMAGSEWSSVIGCSGENS
ncbi:hypothetical protein HK405_001714, partial [Cladochytrium tenue]